MSESDISSKIINNLNLYYRGIRVFEINYTHYFSKTVHFFDIRNYKSNTKTSISTFDIHKNSNLYYGLLISYPTCVYMGYIFLRGIGSPSKKKRFELCQSKF